MIFGLGLLLVYLTLAGQYESITLPFIMLLSVPLAILGALVAQWSRGLIDDVYCQIGLVMLIGLSAKNGILIVEFAEQLRARGLTIVDAAVEAARIRLRPILMTSLAFILGVMPLVFASGAGQEARHSVGTAVAGGMIAVDVSESRVHSRCCTWWSRGHGANRCSEIGCWLRRLAWVPGLLRCGVPAVLRSATAADRTGHVQ